MRPYLLPTEHSQGGGEELIGFRENSSQKRREEKIEFQQKHEGEMF
jgi:hypothetical protein